MVELQRSESATRSVPHVIKTTPTERVEFVASAKTIEEFDQRCRQFVYSLRDRWNTASSVYSIEAVSAKDVSVTLRCGSTPDDCTRGAVTSWLKKTAIAFSAVGRSPDSKWIIAQSPRPKDLFAARIAVIASADTAISDAMETMAAASQTFAETLDRIRRGVEFNAMQFNQTARDETLTQWLHIDVDLLWEASTEGVIHVRRVFHDQKDLAAQIHGRNLRTVYDAESYCNLFDILQKQSFLRRCPVRIADSDSDKKDSGQRVVVSAFAETQPGTNALKRVRGTMTLVGRPQDDGVSAAASLMSRAHGLTLQEEQIRHEADAMLEGLRILLAQGASREKLRRLIDLIARCMKGSNVHTFLPQKDGTVHVLRPNGANDIYHDTRPVRRISEQLSERPLIVFDPESDETELIRNTLDLKGRNIAALALPFYAKAAFLLCTSSAETGFRSANLAAAERLSYLLQHALALRDEQENVVQSAKLSALGQLAISIAHELRQPLNTISLSAENLELLLAAPALDPAAFKKRVERILGQVSRADRVIGRLRRFGRKSETKLERVDIRQAVESARDMMDHVLTNAGVALTLDVDEGIEVSIDALQFEQVLVNLIQNAMDALTGIGTAGPTSNPRIAIRNAVEGADGNDVLLHVEDNGPGFPESIDNGEIETFFTTKPSGTGTGLGLSICNTIVRENGGKFSVGNYDGGARITVRLQRAT